MSSYRGKNWFETMHATEFPPSWEEIVQRRVAIDRLLPEPDRRELRSYIQWFIGSKQFEGYCGLSITAINDAPSVYFRVTDKCYRQRIPVY